MGTNFQNSPTTQSSLTASVTVSPGQATGMCHLDGSNSPSTPVIPSRPLPFATVHSPPQSLHLHISQTALLSCPLPSSAIHCPRMKSKGPQAWHILTSHDLIYSPLPDYAPDTLVSSVPETPKAHSSHRALAHAVSSVWDLRYPSNITTPFRPCYSLTSRPPHPKAALRNPHWISSVSLCILVSATVFA